MKIKSLISLLFVFIFSVLGLTIIFTFVAQGAEKADTQTAVATNSQYQLLDQIGGAANVVVQGGNYLYAGVGPRILVFDLQTDPSEPSFIGQTAVLSDVVNQMVLHGNYMYAIVGNTAVSVIDVQTPQLPTQVGYYTMTQHADNIAIQGNYAYIVQGGDAQQGYDGAGLYTFDISDPTTLSQTHYLDIGDKNFNLAISGGYAYLAYDVGQAAALAIVDLTVPNIPSLVNTVGRGEEILLDPPGMAVNGDYLYVGVYTATDGNGLAIYQISSPTTPALQAIHWGPFFARDVEIVGDYAFIAGSTSGLQIVNVASPDSPVAEGSYDLPGLARGMNVTVNGDYVYLAHGSLGLHSINVVDVTSPAATSVYHPMGWVTDIAAGDSFLYLIEANNGMRIVNKSTLQTTGLYSTTSSLGDIALDDNHVFLTAMSSGFRSVNVADPSAPVEDDAITVAPLPNAVAISGTYTYLANDTNGFSVIDITDPANMSEVGTIPSGLGEVEDVSVFGSEAYLASSEGLQIVDINNPDSPSKINTLNIGFSDSVDVVGNHVFINSGETTLHVIDVSNSSMPTEVFSQTVTSKPIREIKVFGDELFVTEAQGSDGGLRIFDISTPTNPTELFAVDLPGIAQSVATDENNIYVTNDEAGLFIFGRDFPYKLFLPIVAK